jgi:hypothetical protein
MDMTAQDKLKALCSQMGWSESEAKERFFAHHIKQTVLGGTGYGGIQTLNKSWNWGHPDFYLILTSLKDITDEDAIALMKADDGYYGDDKAKWYIENKLFQRFGVVKYEEGMLSSPAADTARGLGYLVPWMGLSADDLIQLGWVKSDQLGCQFCGTEDGKHGWTEDGEVCPLDRTA